MIEVPAQKNIRPSRNAKSCNEIFDFLDKAVNFCKKSTFLICFTKILNCSWLYFDKITGFYINDFSSNIPDVL